MKKLLPLLFLSFSLISAKASAQCIADAGPDKAFCFDQWNNYDTVRVGSIMPVNGGTAPYTYQWTVDGINADAYLSDATLPNPIVIPFAPWPSDSLTLVLTVTDANNITCSDEVIIRSSHFVTITSGPMESTINQGDSVFLTGWILTHSNYPDASYLWRPNAGLNDSTSATFWAKPVVSTVYTVQVTNTAGCKSAWVPCYEVQVLPVSIHEPESRLTGILIYPDPTTDFIFLKINSKYLKADITITDIVGRIYINKKGIVFNAAPERIDISSLRAGIYVITIKDIQGKSSRFKIVKQ